MKRIVFLPEAEGEMLEAARYYELQAPGLGERYLSEVERAVSGVAKSPMMWPIVDNQLRR